MKKNFFLIFLLFFFNACYDFGLENEKTPESQIYLEKIIEKFHSSSEEKIIYNILSKEFSYDILEVNENEEDKKSTIILIVKNKNLSSYKAEYDEFKKKYKQNYNLDNIDENFKDFILSAIESENTKYSKDELEITLIKENDEWILEKSSGNDLFLKYITANVESLF